MAAALLASAAPALGDEAPDYLPVIRQELARLSLDARCNETTSTCTYQRKYPDGTEAHIVILYSAPTHTIYAYIDRFWPLADPQGPGETLARALLKLNREMTTAKTEWDEATNSIRLGVTLNTDSNLDRKALRSQLTGLWQVAQKVRPRLEAISAGRLPTIEKKDNSHEATNN